MARLAELQAPDHIKIRIQFMTNKDCKNNWGYFREKILQLHNLASTDWCCKYLQFSKGRIRLFLFGLVCCYLRGFINLYLNTHCLVLTSWRKSVNTKLTDKMHTFIVDWVLTQKDFISDVTFLLNCDSFLPPYLSLSEGK